MLNFYRLKKFNLFVLALIASAIFHVLFILYVKFEQPAHHFIQDQTSALKVILVNKKSKQKPKKADALAQANLDGGGNTNENRRLKSALPSKNKALTAENIYQIQALENRLEKAEAESARKAQRLAELEKQAQSLMSQLQSDHTIETNPTNKKPLPHAEKGNQDSPNQSLHSADLLASSIEIARMESQIAKEQENYQKRPKRKSLGARAQEYRFAAYVESWREKVERIGNLNYPEAAREQKIYGQLQMSVYIKADGNLEKIEIKRGSGYPILDQAAKHIVEMGAPYAVFPDDIRKDVDIIEITRTWTFTKEDNLTSRGAE
jgi:protein TonB